MALDTQLTRWTDFENLQQEVVTWLTEVEAHIKVGPDPKVELVEKKAQLEKYKVSRTLLSEVLQVLAILSCHLLTTVSL